ncbi:hypothetical protein AOC36_08530 [Erysipelothrix larvae]|uniref:Uncharacterized protein n=1 Tax=Erysipelothrix larvae TaxID=1514105 RepID=A0A0X8H0W0_9FIRM|nr:hypothetical protein [Erysipelothrix larvae]AMC94030.1 hypothetical protein AOC36_08530 [Erysipelothrix larvae]
MDLSNLDFFDKSPEEELIRRLVKTGLTRLEAEFLLYCFFSDRLDDISRPDEDSILNNQYF